MNNSGKQYGLIMQKKVQLSAPITGNVFDDDYNSDTEKGINSVEKSLKGESEKNQWKKQIRLNMQKALNEDPSIYLYDEVYDKIEKKKIRTEAEKKKGMKKTKYIHNLLKAADRRQQKQGHRIERMLHKEREAEGEIVAHKESFVTAAYRAKMQEFKKKIKLLTEEKEESVTHKSDSGISSESSSGAFEVPESKSIRKENTEEPKPTEKKVAIWARRAVSPVFEAALQRFYNRKAMRIAGC